MKDHTTWVSSIISIIVLKLVTLSSASMNEDLFITTLVPDDFCKFHLVQFEKDDIIDRHIQLHPDIHHATRQCQFSLEGPQFCSIINTYLTR